MAEKQCDLLKNGGGNWTYLGSITSNAGTLQIPSTAKEVNIKVLLYAPTQQSLIFSIIKKSYQDNGLRIRDGYYVSAAMSCFAEVDVSSLGVISVGSNGIILNGNAITPNIYVWYR